MARVSSENYESVWKHALAAGQVAELADVPDPMLVRNLDGTAEMVLEGEYGCCRILVDARLPFAKWLIASGHGSAISKSVEVMCSAMSGSLSRAQARTTAVINVLLEAIPIGVVKTEAKRN